MMRRAARRADYDRSISVMPLGTCPARARAAAAAAAGGWSPGWRWKGCGKGPAVVVRASSSTHTQQPLVGSLGEADGGLHIQAAFCLLNHAVEGRFDHLLDEGRSAAL